MSWRPITGAVAVALIVTALVGQALAYDAILAWYPVAGASGYRVYTREAGQSYGNGTNVGGLIPATDGIIRYRKTGLRPDRITYFALACYNAGATSGLSNELSIAAPPTPTPRRTTATPRPTSTVPCTPLAGGGCSPGSPQTLLITKARLQPDSSPTRDNGRLRVSATVDDQGNADLLERAAVAGDLTIAVDAFGQFAAFLELTDCRSTPGSIRCRTADDRGSVKFKRLRNQSFVYGVSIEMHHLTAAETGSELPQGPVHLTLHQGQGVDHEGNLADCPPPTNRALVCSAP